MKPAKIAPLEFFAAKLPAPTSYFNGVGPSAVPLPTSVLMFSRLSRVAMQPRDAFRHGRFVLVLSIETTGSIALDGRWHVLMPGSAILVFPHQVHAFANFRADSLCWLFLTFELQESAWLEELRNQPLKMSPACEHWLEQLLKIWANGKGLAEPVLYLTGLILHELKASHREIGRRTVRGNSRDLGSRTRTHSKAAVGIIGPHLDGLLPRIHAVIENENRAARIKAIASRLGLSESHLRAEFRRHTGISLGHYLRDVRIKRAAALLVESSLRIGEIAERSGFESADAFSRTFRQCVKVGPRAYRKQARSPVDGPQL